MTNTTQALPRPHQTAALSIETVTRLREALIAANVSLYDLLAVEQILDRTDLTLEEAVTEANSADYAGCAEDQCDELPIWGEI